MRRAKKNKKSDQVNDKAIKRKGIYDKNKFVNEKPKEGRWGGGRGARYIA